MLIGKCRRRLPDFEEKIIAMYARGLSKWDIQAHIEELYGIEVSAVTDAVLQELGAWQDRPLDPAHAVSGHGDGRRFGTRAVSRAARRPRS